MRQSKKSEGGGAFKAPPPPGSYRVKDIQLHFQLLEIIRKSIIHAKITLSWKKIFSKLSCTIFSYETEQETTVQTVRLLFSQLLTTPTVIICTGRVTKTTFYQWQWLLGWSLGFSTRSSSQSVLDPNTGIPPPPPKWWNFGDDCVPNGSTGKVAVWVLFIY